MKAVYYSPDDNSPQPEPLQYGGVNVPMFVPPPEGMAEPPNEYFQRNSDLRVIQEYNKEESVPLAVRNDYWGLLSKSIKLGFWDKEDEAALFFHKNIIRIGNIMKNPKFKYTFAERQNMNMVDLLVYADFKRGVGMEKYRINERTLQATSVTQNISGSTTSARKGGLIAGLKSIFS